jgi:hypothetical protein
MDLNELIKNPDQIQNLIQVLQALLPKTEATTTAEPEEDMNTNIKTRGGQKIKKVKSLNKFDKMSEFGMHKEDKEVDKILCRNPPVARSRGGIEPVTVQCRVCGKKELVNPSLVFESASRYKCNSCSTQAG